MKMSVGLGDPSRYPGPQYKSEGYRLEEMVSLSSTNSLSPVPASFTLSYLGLTTGIFFQGPLRYENGEWLGFGSLRAAG